MLAAKNKQKPKKQRRRVQQVAVNLTSEERLFLECNTNPFGNGFQSEGARVVDGMGGHTIPVTLTGNAVVAGAGADWCLQAKLARPNYITARGAGEKCILGCLYQGGAGATVPAAEAFVFASALETIYSMVKKVRIVGGGVKMNIVSPSEESSGVVSGGVSDRDLNNGGAYKLNTLAIQDCEPEVFQISKGMTVRRDFVSTEDLAYANLHTTQATVTNHHEPFVVATHLGASTVVSVDFVIHLEVLVVQALCPFGSTASPTSARFEQLFALVNQRDLCPILATGHSFTSWAGKITKEIWSFIRGVAPLAISVLPPQYQIPARAVYNAVDAIV